jgi:hypothetical protein
MLAAAAALKLYLAQLLYLLVVVAVLVDLMALGTTALAGVLIVQQTAGLAVQGLAELLV